MGRYIIDSEYHSFIQADNLTQLLDGITIDKTEAIAIETEKSFLRHRYDVDFEFRPVVTFSGSAQYYGLDRVEILGEVKVFAAPQPIYDNDRTYYVDDLIYVYGKGVYKCIAPSTGNKYSDTNFWVFVSHTAYAANTQPTQSDDRNLQLVLYTINICLYLVLSRIAPRNVPEHRITAYSDSIKMLEKIQKGVISANIQLLQPETGKRINWGSDDKSQLTY